MSATIGKVYVDAVITDERYKECMALVVGNDHKNTDRKVGKGK